MTRHIPLEIKEAIIKQALERKDRSLSEVASANNIGYSTLKKWLSTNCSGEPLIRLPDAPEFQALQVLGGPVMARGRLAQPQLVVVVRCPHRSFLSTDRRANDGPIGSADTLRCNALGRKMLRARGGSRVRTASLPISCNWSCHAETWDDSGGRDGCTETGKARSTRACNSLIRASSPCACASR